MTGFVYPAMLLAAFEPQFRYCVPESHVPLADGQLRYIHTLEGQVGRHVVSTLAGFTKDGFAAGGYCSCGQSVADHHQHIEFAGFPAQTVVVAVGLDVHPRAIGQRSLSTAPAFLRPLTLRTRHHGRRNSVGDGTD